MFLLFFQGSKKPMEADPLLSARWPGPGGSIPEADLQNARQAARGGAWVVFDDVCFTPLKAPGQR